MKKLWGERRRDLQKKMIQMHYNIKHTYNAYTQENASATINFKWHL